MLPRSENVADGPACGAHRDHGLRAQRDLAEARLAERIIRAPQAGTISDVRIRPGQQLQPGDVLLSLVDADAPCVVIAMVPGHFRPQLAKGMSLRLELDGYRYAYRDVVIDAIGDEIVGPAELKTLPGPRARRHDGCAGPTLLVQAHLPSNTCPARVEKSFTTTTACAPTPRCAFARRTSFSRWFPGCASSSEAPVAEEATLLSRFPALLRLGRLDRPKRVPFIQQLTATECGAACLAMTLAYHGKEVRLERLRDALGVSRDGANAPPS